MSDNALLEISFMLLLSCEELMYVLTCASEIPMREGGRISGKA